MTGGTIRDCSAEYGGAVHLEGGEVTVTGGNINGNVALNGNGGGISINSGSFTLSGDALINANSALMQDSSTQKDVGNGGGVYVTSVTGKVSVNLISGTITGNSSAQKGGGIGVDVSKVQTSAMVTVGEKDASNGPVVTGNVTLLQGGGLYVNGMQANIEVNAGTIKGNSTIGYVDNPDIMNETGMVTLNGGDVRSVNVIYDANGGSLRNDASITTIQQRVVTDTNNKLKAPVYEMSGYQIVRWNTRKDGLGTKDYHDGDIVKISSDLTLYAIWELE